MQSRLGRRLGLPFAAMVVVLGAGLNLTAMAAELPFDPSAAYHCKPAGAETWGGTEIAGAGKDGSRELVIEGSGPKSATCAMEGSSLVCDYGLFQFLGWGNVTLDLASHVPWGDFPIWLVSGTLTGAPWFQLWPPTHSAEIECLVPWTGSMPELPPDKQPVEVKHRRGGEHPF